MMQCMEEKHLFTIFFKGGPHDGQWLRYYLPVTRANVGERQSIPLGVEYGKADRFWPWARNVTRFAEYEFSSVQGPVIFASFVGEKEWSWS